MTASLQAPFSAGSLTWFQYGPSHHAPRHYDRVKLSVLLGSTTSKWRPSPHAVWQRSLPGSVSLCATGQGAEVEFGGEGQLLALQVEPDFIDPAWARTPAAAHLPDLHGVRDPFFFELFAEAATALRQREGTLPKGYAEAVAQLARDRLRRLYTKLTGSVGRRARPAPTLPPFLVNRVVAHIEASLHAPLLVDELAALAEMSPFHFARAFRHSLGETPHRFIVRRRLEFARTLLRSADRFGLAETAYRAGFSSQSHFTRCFRVFHGITPTEFLSQDAAKERRNRKDKARP